jgi:hypothetical protein
MVVARDSGTTPDDLTQRRRLVDIKIMNPVAMIAHRVVHILHEIATERDVDNLSAAADGQ